MIDSIKLDSCLNFSSVDLELDRGLVVITGPSGAGKSVFIDSILGLFGLKEFECLSAEATTQKSLPLEELGIVSEEYTIFKVLRGEKTRYFINNQQISKKRLKELSGSFLKYISHKEFDDFSKESLLQLLDSFITRSSSEFKLQLAEFRALYDEFRETKARLDKIEAEESRVDELKEFAKMQIDKIDSINPKVGEFEELMEFKKKLSKLSKIEEALKEISPIFELEDGVGRFYALIDEDSSLFQSALSELRDRVERSYDFIAESEESDIDALLDRIEKLSALTKRYGSIQEALEFKEQKAKELEHYENLTFEKSRLQKEYERANTNLQKLSHKLSQTRASYLMSLNSDLNEILKKLRLSSATLKLKKCELRDSGGDELTFSLQGAGLDRVSSGEFNRVRLALLALKARYSGDSGVLLLDEIDANLSGEESLATAKLLKELSSYYQIVVISHQPHLPSLASMHLLIKKVKGRSSVTLLSSKEERADEIARMISGENLTKEALMFANDILKKADNHGQ